MDAPAPPFDMPHLYGLLTALAEAVAMDRRSAARREFQQRLYGRPPPPLPAPVGPSTAERSQDVNITIRVPARDRSSSPDSEAAWPAREEKSSPPRAGGDEVYLDALQDAGNISSPPRHSPPCSGYDCRPRSPPALGPQVPDERTTARGSEAGEAGPDQHEDRGCTAEGVTGPEGREEPRFQVSVEPSTE